MITGLRWCLKKGARRGVVALSAPLAALRNGSPSIRVFTYHRFGNLPRDPFCVDEDTFERQMAWLARIGGAVSLADVEGFLRGDRELPQNAVLVTIDDACPSVHSHALPILRKYGVPAVLFAPAGELRPDDDGGAGDETPESRMTHKQLVELASAGVTIGSHAWTHRSLGHLSSESARSEAVRSRTELEKLVGKPVTAFAYPFGTRADFSDETRTILRAAGYTCAFTSQHGAVVRSTDPLTLPRIKVEGGEGLWMFRRLARGGLDAWGWVDRTFWPLQAAGR